MIEKTSRYIRVLSQNLEKLIYDQDNVVKTFSQLARKSSNSEIKLLIKNSADLYHQHHRLIELQQRLPSRIGLRICPWQPEKKDWAYLMGDQNKLLLINNEAIWRGFINYQAHNECNSIKEEFDRLWNHGKEDPEFKKLNI